MFSKSHLSCGSSIWEWNHESTLLANTPSKFSPLRPHRAFIPREAGQHSLPVLYLLAPWLSAGRAMFQWEPFREPLAVRVRRLIDDGHMEPCIIVSPDLYTDFGGSQFVDSSWLGPHASYIVKELIPWVENYLPVMKGASHRGVLGRSSGGFGALRLAMDFPNTFGAVACHAGDMGFDWSAQKSLIDLCTALIKFNHPLDYLTWAYQQKKLSGWDTHILMLLGLCAFYSPNPNEPWGFDLPINLKTAEINRDIYQNWTVHDPVQRAQSEFSQNALHNLKLLFIDCGNRDQYFLQYGSRKLSKILSQAGVKHTYQEFDDNHSGTAYRYDESLPRLVKALI